MERNSLNITEFVMPIGYSVIKTIFFIKTEGSVIILKDTTLSRIKFFLPCSL
jgi:hypothetical protein